ncbi:flagellar type III secretion system pore protein FliP [uncultured Tistrella sp.]|uniref:flagellar type III secretion system pore protein FliP n=1 Tax=Tistrella mobilis TaxID=171437 RepID=UPI00263191F2|nr:flagellar type III secretion system pore protein FliP [uncultured Tistrella sp.]
MKQGVRHKTAQLAGLLILFLLAVLAGSHPAFAQSVTVDLGAEDPGGFTGRIVQLVTLVTVLSLAPGLLVAVTSFTRIVVVLSLLRSALGVQQTPPNAVLIGLAMFLTGFVMTPTFERAWTEGVAPLVAEDITEEEAFDRISAPFRDFMTAHVGERELTAFVDMAALDPEPASVEDVPLQVLVPAFMVSELRRAFEIGFLVFLPFLIIDMLVASLLMSMGMMMLPPVMISLPFKLIFFVLIDGWSLIAGSLVRSFAS